MRKSEKIKVGISIGDLNGIGGEIILKTFEDERVLDFCTPVIFASTKTISFLKRQFDSKINFNGIFDLNKLIHDKLNVMNVWKEAPEINFGQQDEKIGAYAVKSLKAATKALKEKKIDLLLTAPINKHTIQSEEFKFPGHTDYLNQELEGQSVMLMVSGDLRVGLLTDHVPVKKVAETITAALLKTKVEIIHQALIQDFAITKPKIAVLGVNPHSGDNGVIGTEDQEILQPTIEELMKKGLLVFGPYSADSFFGSNTHAQFDAVLAAYHDQGLIPFKTLSFGLGVNYTAGLNRIRTSPDHGTAYEIAGKRQADPGSFKEALFLGLQIYRNRSRYEMYSANPLKKKEATT